MTKTSIFYYNFDFLPKISIFVQNFIFCQIFDFCPIFLTRISIISRNFSYKKGMNFILWKIISILHRILIFVPNFDFCPKFQFFVQNYNYNLQIILSLFFPYMCISLNNFWNNFCDKNGYEKYNFFITKKTKKDELAILTVLYRSIGFI